MVLEKSDMTVIKHYYAVRSEKSELRPIVDTDVDFLRMS